MLIGLGGIAAAGALAGGIYFATSGDFSFLKQEGEEERERQENTEKIEALYFDELKDTDRYAFCLGVEKITGTYRNTVMANEEGELSYSSSDISLLDKESQKLYLLGRTIDYQYQGESQPELGIGNGLIQVEESGRLTEYYKKSEAPIRLDYFSKTLFPAPERQSKDWVMVTNKLTGSLMGVTQERTETSQEDAKTFCGPINLKLSAKASADQEPIAYSGNCVAPEVNPGVSFSGHHNYNCNFIDYKRAIELLEDYKTKQALPKLGDLPTEPDEVRADQSAQTEQAEGVESSRPNSDEIKKQLEDLRQEIQADQSAQ